MPLLLEVLFATLLASNANEKFDKLLKEKIEALADVSARFTNAFGQSARCRSSKHCNDGDCLPNGCSHYSFGRNYECSSILQTLGQYNFCAQSCIPQSRLLNLETSILTTPPNTLRYNKDGEVQKIEVESLHLRRDVCAFKTIQPALLKAFRKHNLKSWIYVSSNTGLMMTYPGAALHRDEPDLRKCGYVPMSRPWYVAAASGSKDVVFLFDRTSLTSAEKVLPKALRSELERLHIDDHVAVLALSEKVEVLGDPHSGTLKRANDAFKKKLVEDVERLQPSSGQPAIKDGIETAFNILRKSEAEQSSSLCSRIIVLLIGNAPACFDACNGKSSGECQCTADIVRAVQTQKRSSGRDVSIVAFTEGNNNDAKRVARSIVCEASTGSVASVWNQVKDSDTPESALSAYTDIASQTQTSTDYTSNMYNDDLGLGEMITIARPMYETETNALVGVCGVDITITEIAQRVGGRDAAKAAIENQIRKERRLCKPKTPNSCAQQRLRSKYGGICADVLVREKNAWKCFKAGNSLFLRSTDLQPWGNARKNCQRMGSGVDLAVLDNQGKNEIAAAISEYDGSWIGLRTIESDELMWINERSFEYKNFSFDFDFGASINRIRDRMLVEACVSVDRRGTAGNWNVVPCDAKRFAMRINAENVTSLCPPSHIFDSRTTEYEEVHRVDCDSSETDECPVDTDSDDSLRKANPHCPEKEGLPTTDFDRICCGGRADSGATQCPKTESESSRGVVIGSAVGGAVLFCLAILVVILCLRKKKNTKKAVDNSRPGSCGNFPESVHEGSEDTFLPFPVHDGKGHSFQNVEHTTPSDLYDNLDI